MPVPGETEDVREKYVAKVIGVHLVPAYESSIPKGTEEKTIICQLAFSAENIGQQIPELLVHVAGNILAGGKVKLIDLELPESFVRGFKGPKFGLEGVRELLGMPKRPLFVSMIKPCSGIPPKVVANLVY